MIGLIENPFKHALSGQESDFIHIQICFEYSQLTLEIKNSNHEFKNKMIDSGIGIDNIRKRLNLLYQYKYNLFRNNKKLGPATMLLDSFSSGGL